MTIWSSEDTNLDIADFFSKVAICISARAHHNSYCMDLSSAHQFPGSTKAPVCTAWDIKVFFITSRVVSLSYLQREIRYLGGA